MRRNPRGGIGRGQTWQSNSRASVAPLLTDRLGLQDIDKELELLQRKRQIIEQQQQILSNEFRRNDYQEPYQASNSQNSRYDEYTQSYDDYTQSYDDDVRDYNPPSRKRPIQVWEDDVPNKRFSGQTRSQSRPFIRPSASSIPPLLRSGPTFRGGYQGSQPRQSRPHSSTFRPKMPKRDQIPPKKVSNPPKKVANAPKATKSTAAPNKSIDHPVVERKVPETGTSAVPAVDLNYMLCSDREPSKHVTGRLELALGGIIKEIKVVHPNALKTTAVMRDVKSVVRERLRELMMNQVIGPSETIRARYREVYDAQSDAEIVTNALEAQCVEVPVLKMVDDPEKYFKTNMHKIMQLRMKSLLDKLNQICMDECINETGAASETTADETPEATEFEKIELDEEITKTAKYIALEKWMSTRMTGLIKKFIPYFIKLMNIDVKYTKLKKMVTSETVKMLMQKNGQEIGEQNDETMRSITESFNSTNTSISRSPYKPLPYFAKLLGKPSLPKRNQMEKFFAEYEPKSIKKHRVVHNLLFVGFDDKESFDNFLAADGTSIGRYTLSVRVSERASDTKNDGQAELKAFSDGINKPELDNQIPTSEKGEGVGETADNEVADNNIAADANDTTTSNVDENKATVVDNENNAENDDTYVEENADADNTENADADNTENANADNTENADADYAENADADYAENANTDNAENGGTVTEENEHAGSNNAAETNNGSTDEPGNGDIETKQENKVIAEESTDEVLPLDGNAPPGKATPAPARVSARLAATPGRIQTRRSSRMAFNDA